MTPTQLHNTRKWFQDFTSKNTQIYGLQLCDELKQAQAEVERLKMELIAAQPLYSRRQLEEKNERYKQALEAIASAPRCCGCSDDWGVMRETAQQALKGGDAA